MPEKVTAPESAEQDGEISEAKESPTFDIREHPEFHKLKSTRDAAKQKARELEKQLEELRQQVEGKQHEDAVKAGDVDALRESYENKLSKVSEQLQSKEQLLQTFAVKSEVSSVAQRQLSPEGVELFLKVHGDDFGVRSGDSGLEVFVKDSALNVSELVEQFKEKYAGLAANPVRGGTGSSGGKNSVDAGAMSVEQVAKLGYSERKKVLGENKELRDAYSRARMRG